jgi:hypothetical protein
MNGCVVTQVVERESMLFGGFAMLKRRDRQKNVCIDNGNQKRQEVDRPATVDRLQCSQRSDHMAIVPNVCKQHSELCMSMQAMAESAERQASD